jgi:hypothetical protein
VKRNLKNLLIAVPFLTIFFISWETKKKSSDQSEINIVILFNAVVGDKQFFPDSTYTNSFGEDFSVSKFKYYISNIELENATTGKKKSIPNSYFLVDESDSSSKNILINVTSNFTRISFLIGVDSVKNVGGAQSGALDPVNDMFWTWNTGYVMAKMEGTSPVSKQVHHKFEYHIGGFKGENNVLQRINIPIPSLENSSDKKNFKLIIDTDINAWFHGSHNLPIAQNPVCTTPGLLAKQFSENYRNMFKVRSVLQIK